MVLWDKVKLQTETLWRLLCVYLERASAQLGWLVLKIGLTDTGLFSLSVKVRVDWCEVVVVCLLPSVWDVWLDSARQNNARRFPATDRCVKAESALETQPCHLRHATVSFPLTSSGSEMSLLFNSKESSSFSRIFKCFLLLDWLKKSTEISRTFFFLFLFQQEEQ